MTDAETKLGEVIERQPASGDVLQLEDIPAFTTEELDQMINGVQAAK